MSQQAESHESKRMLSTGIRVGTQVKTKFMKRFITETTPEGLYKLDLDVTLRRISIAARFISRAGPERTLVCSGRENANTPVEKFCELVGAVPKLQRFMPGTLTNPSLGYYTEPGLVVVTDPQVDSQAVTEATNAGIPVVGVANTDNITSRVDLVIPANNRGRRALATVYWLLAREILLERGDIKEREGMPYEIDDFETKMTEESPE